MGPVPIRGLIKIIMIASLMLGARYLFANPHIDFTSPLGGEKWRMSGNPLRCGLSLVIPNYGVGYFEQYATKSPHFILRKWAEVQKSLPALVLASPPSWKPFEKTYLVTRTSIKPGEYGLYLERDPTLKLLSYLSEGYQAVFHYRSEEGFTTSIIFSPVHFQKVYGKYQQCLSGLLPFDYQQVKQTVFHFNVDSRTLTDQDKEQLQKIARYVDADVQVQVIQVVGYADDSGRKGYNNAVSQFRAETIKKYLLNLGVPKNKLLVTWYGALKPVERNDTDAGRAANRRVVVDVIKK